MNWSAYRYLIVVALACVAFLFFCIRRMPLLLHKSRTRSVVELVTLACVVCLSLTAIYYNFYREYLSFVYLDVGNDTSEQYVPFYCNMLSAIQSGTFGAWNHEYGLGTSFMSYQSWTLDPFNLVLIPLGLLLGTSHIGLVLAIVQSVKVICVAFLADHLLTYYCETPLSRILGALLCAFSGYLMLWGQHYWLGTVFVMAVLLPLLLELLMERWTPGRFVTLALSVTLAIASSIYSGFMVMLFATAYALMRVAYISVGDIRGYLRLFGRLTLPVVCGIVTSLMFVIPYASLMLGESTRVVGAGNGSTASRALDFLSTFVPLRWIPMLLSRIMGNGLVSYGDAIPSDVMAAVEVFPYINVYEVLMVGLSVAAFVLLAQFASWAIRDSCRRVKVLVGISFALVVLYCINFFLPALSNAFVAPKYRSSFAVALPLCIAMAVGFDKRVAPAKVDRGALAVSSLLSLCVVLWSLVHTVDGRLSCLWYLVSLCGITAFLWLLHGNPAHGHSSAHASSSPSRATSSLQQHVLLALCCALIVSTSVADGFFSTNNRDLCTPGDTPGIIGTTRDADTMAALAWLRDYDPTFWRAEKTYSNWTWLNDSLIQEYPGVSSYNSTLDADIEDFYYQLWPEAIGGDIAYQVFRNDPNQPSLLSMLGVKYLLSDVPLTWSWCREVTSFGNIHVYRNMRASSILTLRSGVMTETEAADLDAAQRRSVLDALAIVPDEALPLLVTETPSEVELDDLASLDLSWMELEDWQLDGDGHPAAIPASRSRIESTDGSTLSGTVFANVDSIACLALPHVSGWSVSLDGKPVETTRINYGFIGFAVPSGVHTVEVRYTIPGLTLGLLLSLCGVLATILCCVIIARQQAWVRHKSTGVAAHP